MMSIGYVDQTFYALPIRPSYTPFLRDLFRCSTLRLDDLAICVIGAAVSIAWFELPKVSGNRNGRKQAATSASLSA